jgi:hypothetical protein
VIPKEILTQLSILNAINISIRKGMLREASFALTFTISKMQKRRAG